MFSHCGYEARTSSLILHSFQWPAVTFCFLERFWLHLMHANQLVLLQQQLLHVPGCCCVHVIYRAIWVKYNILIRLMSTQSLWPLTDARTDNNYSLFWIFIVFIQIIKWSSSTFGSPQDKIRVSGMTELDDYMIILCNDGFKRIIRQKHFIYLI